MFEIDLRGNKSYFAIREKANALRRGNTLFEFILRVSDGSEIFSQEWGWWNEEQIPLAGTLKWEDRVRNRMEL